MAGSLAHLQFSDSTGSLTHSDREEIPAGLLLVFLYALPAL